MLPRREHVLIVHLAAEFDGSHNQGFRRELKFVDMVAAAYLAG